MPFGLGFGEMILIFFVLLLLFGAKRLPELASGMGKGIRDFKRAVNGLDEQSIAAGEQPNYLQPPPPPAAQPPVSAPAASAIEEPRRAQ
jgi:sec-independent protein translocase protein TatA